MSRHARSLVAVLLLLAAASSSFQAGPGLLKALARRRGRDGEEQGILHPALGATNRHHTPYWSVLVYLVVSLTVVVVADAREQSLVLFYAVSVFVSFLAGLVAMARFSLRERDKRHLLVNAIGAIVVAFTLAVNLARGYPVLSLAASIAIGGAFAHLWIRQGRPRGIAQAERAMEIGAEAEVLGGPPGAV